MLTVKIVRGSCRDDPRRDPPAQQDRERAASNPSIASCHGANKEDTIAGLFGVRKYAVIAVIACAVVLAAGVLIGRWLLLNNGPCTIDYGVIASWIAALGTVGLVVIGGVGAVYAYRTAWSAIEAIRLKTAPFILAEADVTDQKPDFTIGFKLYKEKLLQCAPDYSRGGLRISIRNLGERPVFNVSVTIRIEDIHKAYEPVTQRFFSQLLIPMSNAVILIQNNVATVLQASVVGGSVGSESRPGQSEPVHVFESGIFPMPIV